MYSLVEEFKKIAGLLDMAAKGLSYIKNSPQLGQAGNIARNSLASGWHGLKEDPNKWYGTVKRNILGKDRTVLAYPGAKAMTVGFTGLQLPGALQEEDPTGQGRSRAERLLQLGAGTVGGLAGGSLINKNIGGAKGMLAQGLTGMAGQTLAEKAVSIPFKPFRAKNKPQELRNPQEYSNTLSSPIN
jgi:hypothetical protein